MLNGQSAKKVVRKTAGSRNHLCAFRIPHQTRRLLHRSDLAGSRYYCYSFNSRSHCLPDLEAQTRLRMVEKEGNNGKTFF